MVTDYLAGTPIRVDRFQFSEGTQYYLCSHAHADHLEGLTPTWRHGTLVCSRVTARLLCHRFGDELRQVMRVLEIGESAVFDHTSHPSFSLTLIEANHCPGACMFLVEGAFGTLLHTGDFQYHPSIIDSSCLKRKRIDYLIIDNTFCSPCFEFQTLDQTIDEMVALIQSRPGHEIWIGIDSLGRELLLCELSRRLHTLIVVSEQRMSLLRALEDEPAHDAHLDLLSPSPSSSPTSLLSEQSATSDTLSLAMNSMSSSASSSSSPLPSLPVRFVDEHFTTNEDEGFIRVVSKQQVSAHALQQVNQRRPVFAIRPTGWACLSRNHRQNVDAANSASEIPSNLALQSTSTQPCSSSFLIHSIPYSLHSSFSQLCAFVRRLRPCSIFPLLSESASDCMLHLGSIVRESLQEMRLESPPPLQQVFSCRASRLQSHRVFHVDDGKTSASASSASSNLSNANSSSSVSTFTRMHTSLDNRRLFYVQQQLSRNRTSSGRIMPRSPSPPLPLPLPRASIARTEPSSALIDLSASPSDDPASTYQPDANGKSADHIQASNVESAVALSDRAIAEAIASGLDDAGEDFEHEIGFPASSSQSHLSAESTSHQHQCAICETRLSSSSVTSTASPHKLADDKIRLAIELGLEHFSSQSHNLPMPMLSSQDDEESPFIEIGPVVDEDDDDVGFFHQRKSMGGNASAESESLKNQPCAASQPIISEPDQDQTDAFFFSETSSVTVSAVDASKPWGLRCRPASKSSKSSSSSTNKKRKHSEFSTESSESTTDASSSSSSTAIAAVASAIKSTQSALPPSFRTSVVGSVIEAPQARQWPVLDLIARSHSPATSESSSASAQISPPSLPASSSLAVERSRAASTSITSFLIAAMTESSSSPSSSKSKPRPKFASEDDEFLAEDSNTQSQSMIAASAAAITGSVKRASVSLSNRLTEHKPPSSSSATTFPRAIQRVTEPAQQHSVVEEIDSSFSEEPSLSASKRHRVVKSREEARMRMWLFGSQKASAPPPSQSSIL